MQLFDAVTLGGPRLTRDGYLVADARIARTGIQIYAGREVDRPDLGTVRVYRPEAEVFSTDALASFAHRPVTNDHPAESVSARNWKTHSVGMTGAEIARDGAFVRVPMVVMDQAAIADVQAGKRELSCGYTCDLKWEPGMTADGQAYDAIQTNIRGNHLAIVSAGRAGMDCRLGDGALDHRGDRHMALKTIIVDGLPVETTDAGEAAVNKLRGLLSVADAALANAKTTHDAALAAKDAEIAKRDAEITDLKAKVLDGAALDAVVAERAAIVSKAKSIDANVVTDGKPNAEIKRAVLGDAAKDKSDAYVDAAFDLKTAGTANDTVRDAIRQQDHSITTNDAWGDGVFAAAGVQKKGA
jgi:hypothetical protein